MAEDFVNPGFVHSTDPAAAARPIHPGTEGGAGRRGAGHGDGGEGDEPRGEALTPERLAQLELEVEEANEALAAAGSPVRLALLAEDGTHDVAVTVPDASGTPSYCVARRLRPDEFTDWARRLIELEGLVIDRAG